MCKKKTQLTNKNLNNVEREIVACWLQSSALVRMEFYVVDKYFMPIRYMGAVKSLEVQHHLSHKNCIYV